jgi:hypothetical protein
MTLLLLLGGSTTNPAGPAVTITLGAPAGGLIGQFLAGPVANIALGAPAGVVVMVIAGPAAGITFNAFAGSAFAVLRNPLQVRIPPSATIVSLPGPTRVQFPPPTTQSDFS